MNLFFANKAVRFVLAVSVSIWMAGGCLFGCSNTSMAADPALETQSSAQVVQSGDSCHAMRAHDCCSAEKPKKPSVNNVKKPGGVAFFVPAQRGMMKDCPLIVNSTAATSKGNTHLFEPGRGSVATLPRFEKQTELAGNTLVVPYLPNRGPTHLRCCVFLI